MLLTNLLEEALSLTENNIFFISLYVVNSKSLKKIEKYITGVFSRVDRINNDNHYKLEPQ